MNPKLTALIADDEEAPREQLRAALARRWPELQIVAASSNGVEAWDDCLAHEPAVAFLDIRMPGMTGLEVARREGDRVVVTVRDDGPGLAPGWADGVGLSNTRRRLLAALPHASLTLTDAAPGCVATLTL